MRLRFAISSPLLDGEEDSAVDSACKKNRGPKGPLHLHRLVNRSETQSQTKLGVTAFVFGCPRKSVEPALLSLNLRALIPESVDQAGGFYILCLRLCVVVIKEVIHLRA